MSDDMDPEMMDGEEDMEDEEDEEQEDNDDAQDGGQGNSGHPASESQDYRRMLFIKFPGKKTPSRDAIMALNSDIISVEFPTVKLQKFVWVEFETREKAAKALDDLGKVKFENGYLRVSWRSNPDLPRRFRHEPNSRKKWVVIEGIPLDSTMEEVKDEICGVIRVSLGKAKHKKRIPPGSAIIVFNSVKNAMDFCEDQKNHTYKGKPVRVRYLKTGPSKKTLQKRRRDARRKQYERGLSGGGQW